MVAVVGASRDPSKVGHAVLKNLIDGGFPGTILPVNPNASSIEGLPCYPSLRDLPVAPDLTIVVVPASSVPQVISTCGAIGCHSAVVISAGFKETGPEGLTLERELVESAAACSVRVLGPNCLGLIVPGSRLNASFAPVGALDGAIAFMSQSGALGTAILDWAASAHIGLSHFVSLGNKADIDEVDLLEAWRDDPRVNVVACYLEAIEDGRRFIEAARELTRVKPLVVLKAGVSDAGARAVSSHTGSLAGSDAAYDAAFRKVGAIRARSIEELFDLAVAFSTRRDARPEGLCVVTNAGGPAILATDAAEAEHLRLASLDASTIEALRTNLPPAAAVYNPVDVLGDASADRYERTLTTIVRDPGVGAVLTILTPQAMTEAAETATSIVRLAQDSPCTVLASFMGGSSVAPGIEILRQHGVPQFDFPERAIRALVALERYARERDRPSHRQPSIGADRQTVRAAIDHARLAGRTFITEHSAMRVARAYGLPTVPGGLARDLPEALGIASEVGYPVVLKIASPDILHKTDVGGVRIGIETPDELRSAYDAVLSNAHRRMPDASIWGVTVQRQATTGREVIIGVMRDAHFGHLVMFGLGGIYVEALRDVTFRLAPLDEHEAREMITGIRGFPILKGVRGEAPADTDAIADALVRVSALVNDFPDIGELDINPLIVGSIGEGVLVADIRIGIGG